jgi:hypothetical protein
MRDKLTKGSDCVPWPCTHCSSGFADSSSTAPASKLRFAGRFDGLFPMHATDSRQLESRQSCNGRPTIEKEGSRAKDILEFCAPSLNRLRPMIAMLGPRLAFSELPNVQQAAWQRECGNVGSALALGQFFAAKKFRT